MHTKTNNYLYAYKFKIPEEYKNVFFEDNFPKSKLFDNIHQFDTDGYHMTLEYMGKNNGALFFQFSKLIDKNIKLTDLKNFIQRIFRREKWEKVTYTSYFAYYPEQNLILGLYNYFAFSHIIDTLKQYLKEKHNITKIKCEPIRIPPPDSEKRLKELKYVNKVTIVTAVKKIDIEEQNTNPFCSLEKYKSKGYVTIDFPHLKQYDVTEVILRLKHYFTRDDVKHIFIKSPDLNCDLLSLIIRNWECPINTDKDGFASFEDFKLKVTQKYEENKDELTGY